METAPYLEYADCVNIVSDSFKELVTSDKICILSKISHILVNLNTFQPSLLNVSSKTYFLFPLDKAIEKGNAGKGFYTQRNGESVQRLRGVISTTFVDTSTNRQVLTITDLTKHLSWINEMTDEINQNRRTSEVIDVRFPKKEIVRSRNYRPKNKT